MDSLILTIILQIVGTLAILAEILIPSFGLLTLAAIGFFAYSYWLVYMQNPAAVIFLVIINVISIPATLIFVVRRLKKSKTISLVETIDTEAVVFAAKIGEEGVAITDLRPAGVAVINDKHIDVYSEGGYIQKGAKIKVISTENAGVKVALIEG